MRHSFLLALLLSCVSPLAIAQDTATQDNGRTVSVYGTGYVEGEADRAVVTLAFEGSGSSLGAAVADAQQRVAETTDALRRLGLDETAFATSRFSGYEGGRPFLFAKREYRSGIVLTVTVDDIERIDTVVIALSQEPVERIAGIQFALHDLDALRRSVRADALADAQAKATAMAAGFGLTLGPVLRIDEEPAIRQNTNLRYYADGVRVAEQLVVTRERPVQPEVQVFAERFAVQAGVRVTYGLDG